MEKASPEEIERNPVSSAADECSSTGPARKKSRTDSETAVDADDVINATESGRCIKNNGIEAAVIDSLPADALTIAIGFVGPGRFRYVAGTCRRLREAYLEAHPSADGGKQATYWSSAAESVPCAALCLKEARRGEEEEDDDNSSESNVSVKSWEDESAVAAPRGPVRRIGEAAAERTGRLDVIRWLEKEHGFDPNDHWNERERRIGEKGDASFISFSHFRKVLRKNDGARLLLDCAALGGNLHIVRHYAERRDCLWDGWTVAEAALGGHVKVVKYFLESWSSHRVNLDSVVNVSAMGGHLEVLQCLHGLGVDLGSADVLAKAAKKGHLETVKFLHGNYSFGRIPNAIDNDESRASSQRWVMRATAIGGHINVMEYFRAQGLSLSKGEFISAAAYGRIPMLAYLHSHHVPWDIHVCTNAAMTGHLDALKFLVGKGCPFDQDEAREGAINCECTEVVEWIASYAGKERNIT